LDWIGLDIVCVLQTQEEMLQDRIRSIEQLERHYDNLQLEKRKVIQS
jgi:hypothetical protein